MNQGNVSINGGLVHGIDKFKGMGFWVVDRLAVEKDITIREPAPHLRAE
jgi:hypothetical protein